MPRFEHSNAVSVYAGQSAQKKGQAVGLSSFFLLGLLIVNAYDGRVFKAVHALPVDSSVE